MIHSLHVTHVVRRSRASGWLPAGQAMQYFLWLTETKVVQENRNLVKVGLLLLCASHHERRRYQELLL